MTLPARAALKRAVVGTIASAVLVAAAWMVGWMALPDDIAATCWGCRVPIGFMVMILIGSLASLVYFVGDFVLFILTGSDK